MNAAWFGDSCDIVKRYFVGVLKDAGYRVYVDPMFTGDSRGIEKPFHRFIGAPKFDGKKSPGDRTALLLDPDTGIGRRETEQHVTIDDILRELERHDVVFSFDQSFSRKQSPKDQMKEKLGRITATGRFAFYYDSHARFLFVARARNDIKLVADALRASGLPEGRLVR